MKTLILCVDLGGRRIIKKGVISPIIGRKDNLKAAIALALKDPEDSDINSLFAAIQEYDSRANEDQEVEIATICGDKDVGTRSDQILAAQLESVLREVEPDGVIFISDGAEDEFIKPLIASRTKIDAVRRVIVRQQKDIESTYYIITNALKDEKVLKKIGVPITVVLFIWSLFSILSLTIGYYSDRPLPDYGLAATLMALAIYIFIRIFRLETAFTSVGKDIKLALERGRYIQLISTFLALIIAGYGFFIRGIYQLYQRNLSDPEFFISLIDKSMWWILAAVLIYSIGKAIDLYYRKGLTFRPLPSITLSVFTIGFILPAILNIASYLILNDAFNVTENFVLVLIGFSFLFMTIWVHFYLRERYISKASRAGWRR
jgi:putative membrane protein